MKKRPESARILGTEKSTVKSEAQLAVRPQRVRALFVSDVHLGSPHCCANEFLAMLHSYQPERLYLVGDIIDGRRLRKMWHWPAIYNQILARVSELMESGTKVFYTPGNHDEFFREVLPHLPALFRGDRFQIADEFLYESRNGARLLVTHGDQFDRHEEACGFVSRLVTVTYDWLLHLDSGLTRLFPRRRRRQTARQVKSRIPRIAQFISEYETIATDYAERAGYDGVICGHVHDPKIVSRKAISYCNTGDWIEHGSALVEHREGHWELTYFQPEQHVPEFNNQHATVERESLTWWTSPAGQNISVTLLKSNAWTRRHSFPEELNGDPSASTSRNGGNSAHAAAQKRIQPSPQEPTGKTSQTEKTEF